MFSAIISRLLIQPWAGNQCMGNFIINSGIHDNGNIKCPHGLPDCSGSRGTTASLINHEVSFKIPDADTDPIRCRRHMVGQFPPSRITLIAVVPSQFAQVIDECEERRLWFGRLVEIAYNVHDDHRMQWVGRPHAVAKILAIRCDIGEIAAPIGGVQKRGITVQDSGSQQNIESALAVVDYFPEKTIICQEDECI